MTARVALALVHHPVLDAKAARTTTAVTNLDVHDLARSGRTFGCTDVFITHPVLAQRQLVDRICEHWIHGSSGARIPDRKEALTLVRSVASLEEAAEACGGRAGLEVWVTAARAVAPPISFAEARVRVTDASRRILIVFGTGWGLAPEVIAAADAVLPPVRASVASGYNHLSVRAACAIILDRLRGER